MIVALDGEAESAKSGFPPAPESAMACGLPAALSLIERLPFLGPGAVGVKVTLIKQAALVARLVAQLFVWAKSPLVEIPSIVIGNVPLFARVTVCGALVVPTFCAPKINDEVDKLRMGPVPDPLNGIT